MKKSLALNLDEEQTSLLRNIQVDIESLDRSSKRLFKTKVGSLIFYALGM